MRLETYPPPQMLFSCSISQTAFLLWSLSRPQQRTKFPPTLKTPIIRLNSYPKEEVNKYPSAITPYAPITLVFSNWRFGSGSFSFVLLGYCTHPSHALLCSLVDTMKAPLHACSKNRSRAACDPLRFLVAMVASYQLNPSTWKMRSQRASCLW